MGETALGRQSLIKAYQLRQRASDGERFFIDTRPQLARALALLGDTVKANRRYGDLLTLWKDADAGAPVIKAARSEHAKLR